MTTRHSIENLLKRKTNQELNHSPPQQNLSNFLVAQAITAQLYRDHYHRQQQQAQLEEAWVEQVKDIKEDTSSDKETSDNETKMFSANDTSSGCFDDELDHCSRLVLINLFRLKLDL